MNDKKFILEDNVLEHLKYLQDIIKRMADNSFKIKGWCITLTSALLGLLVASENVSNKEMIIVVVPVIGFWLMDTYYLNLERIFRDRYESDVEKIKNKKLDEVNLFSYSKRILKGNKTKIVYESIEKYLKFIGKNIVKVLNFISVFFSSSMLLTYIPIILIIFFIINIIK